MNRKLQCFLLIWTLLFSLASYAQEKAITGTVTTVVNGTPLPGVNVLVKGTTKGTQTDFDGNYTIDAKEGDILVLSYIGMKTQNVTVGPTAILDIAMEEDADQLDEVVVVGYGTQRRSDLTGAVSSVSSKDLTEIPLARTDQLLQGRVAGLNVSSTDGAPGGNVKIRIRGANSINGSNSPLVVIDGFLGGSLDNINPQDIQSIEVLKDASATAVYGSRGANGVILVTTKSGRPGKIKVDFDTYVTMSSLRKKIDLLNAAEYAGVENAYSIGKGGTTVYSDDELAFYRNTGGTDWQDQIFKNATEHNYNLAVSGGNEKTTYLVSLNHLNQDGIMINSSYKRYQLRTNLTSNLNDKTRIGLRMYGIREESNPQAFNASSGTPVSDALSYPALVQSVYDENGEFNQTGESGYWNPVASALSYNQDRLENTFNTNAFVEYSFNDNLMLRISGGVSYFASNAYQFRSSDNRNAFANNGDGSVANRENIGWINTNNLTYTKEIGDDNLTATVVYEQQQSGPDRASGFGVSNFITESLGYYGAGLAETVSGQYVYSIKKRSIQSFLGRVNYNLADKLLFTLSGRYDGSSVLSYGNKWAFFPSAAMAWNILPDLKIRASYGKVGSQAVPVFSSKSTLESGVNYALDGSTQSVGVSLSNLGNSKLGWETTSQYDFGVNAGFFNNRLILEADYYHKTTKDLLLNVSLPYITGLPTGANPPTTLKNLGEMENKGVEFSATGVLISNDKVHWDVTLNLATNRSRVLDLGEEDQILGGVFGGSSLPPLFIIEKGEPLGNIRGLAFEGVWKSSEATEAAIYGNVPGDSKYRDVNGDGIIDDGDRITIGNGTPEWTWGLSSGLSYGNFDASIFINGANEYDLYNFSRNRYVDKRNGPELLNRWSPSNENTMIPAFSKTETDKPNTSRFLEDGSFIRLKNISLGYTLPSNVMDRLNLSKIRVYVSGQNLWTITDYSGFDPEVNSAGSSDTNVGLDLGGYPPSKSFTLGLNLSF